MCWPQQVTSTGAPHSAPGDDNVCHQATHNAAEMLLAVALHSGAEHEWHCWLPRMGDTEAVTHCSDGSNKGVTLPTARPTTAGPGPRATVHLRGKASATAGTCF